MAPPAKRQKRLVIESSPSDSENDERLEDTITAQSNGLISSSSSSSKPTGTDKTAATSDRTLRASNRTQPRATTANHPHNAAPIYLPTKSSKTYKSASSSPEKRKKSRKMDEKGKSGDIFALFTKQSQRQQVTSSSTRNNNTAPKWSSIEVEDIDGISDNDEDNVAERKAHQASFIGDAARKRAKDFGNLGNGDADAPSASQKFKKTSTIEESTIKTTIEDDLRPWAERFSPTNLDELAVHKKKVADVRLWLEEVLAGKRRQRLLLLKGAAGTAKTTTVQLLAKAMDCEILEWRNPVGSVATSDGYQSASAQFEEFMGRGGKFGQLDLFSDGGEKIPKPETKPLDRRKRLILIEEFPNTFTRSSTALQSFRSAIVSYLAANVPPISIMYNNNQNLDPVTPIVMVVSETLLTTTSASADSFTAHRLLGPEILQHPGVFTIEFNAIAPTILAKALEAIVLKEARKSGRRKTPGPLVLKKLGEIGDIRSAIGSLEFMCLRRDVDADWGSKVAFSKTKKASKDAIALTKMEKESLELITRREASLGIFHAVGKVVYNKRDESVSLPQDVEQLPNFMSLHCRPRRSQVNIDELIDETGTDTQTFVAALHENYILSCDASPSSYDFSTLDHVNGCMDALSDSDLLCPSWDGSFNSTGFGGGVGGRGSGGDILRQDEISFQTAVRGILFSLPSPVKRQAPAAAGLRTGRGGDAFKMFYPTSLKLWRTKEEIESSIDLWVARLMKGEDHSSTGITAGAAAFTKPRGGTVESWKQRNSAIEKPNETASKPLLSVGTSARKEMLLERLPYMVHIARSRPSTRSVIDIRTMEKVTSFHGIAGPSDDNSEDVDEIGVVGEEWATDRPVEGTSPQKKVKKVLVIRESGLGRTVSVQLEQKLVISDDDIEDD